MQRPQTELNWPGQPHPDVDHVAVASHRGAKMPWRVRPGRGRIPVPQTGESDAWSGHGRLRSWGVAGGVASRDSCHRPRAALSGTDHDPATAVISVRTVVLLCHRSAPNPRSRSSPAPPPEATRRPMTQVDRSSTSADPTASRRRRPGTQPRGDPGHPRQTGDRRATVHAGDAQVLRRDVDGLVPCRQRCETSEWTGNRRMRRRSTCSGPVATAALMVVARPAACCSGGRNGSSGPTSRATPSRHRARDGAPVATPETLPAATQPGDPDDPCTVPGDRAFRASTPMPRHNYTQYVTTCASATSVPRWSSAGWSSSCSRSSSGSPGSSRWLRVRAGQDYPSS